MSVEVNKYGVNKCIKAYLLSDERMREIGFTDYRKGNWYFCRDLIKGDISFNVTINKKDAEDLRIDVLDEHFGQPYDYQYYLINDPNFDFAIKVRDKVEYWMEYLQGNGVLSGHVKGEYI